MGDPFEGTAPHTGCREAPLDGMTRRAARCLGTTFTVAVPLTLALVAWAALWVLRWRRGRSR
ncbi:hypothetical protein CHR28_05470 [Streptomyces sp. XY006]|nr:hypothetical protein CHR28_05470 [Streptomyces sp. XY006]